MICLALKLFKKLLRRYFLGHKNLLVEVMRCPYADASHVPGSATTAKPLSWQNDPRPLGRGEKQNHHCPLAGVPAAWVRSRPQCAPNRPAQSFCPGLAHRRFIAREIGLTASRHLPNGKY